MMEPLAATLHHDAVPGTAARTMVDQQTIRRRGTGLKAFDPALACEGYTLFAPMFGTGDVYLIDMHGMVVHEWKLPYQPGMYGYLLENGHLLFGGKHGRDELPMWKGGVVMEVDWDGRVVWTVREPDHHHDARKLRNGHVIMLCMEKIPRDLVPRVQGGMPGTELDGDMYADYVVEVTTRGERVWQWHSHEHLDPERDRITPQDHRKDWTHGNAVVELPDGNLMVSFRNISTIVIIDRSTGRIVWKLGPPLLAQQHDPTPLPNGRLLVFDNGTHRQNDPVPYSRVIELDIASSAIAWEYRDPTNISFFSPYNSSAQRLPNGNTLVCEACFGRLFEVTPEREVVWEYVSPYFSQSPHYGLVNYVFKAFRYPVADVAAWSRR